MTAAIFLSSAEALYAGNATAQPRRNDNPDLTVACATIESTHSTTSDTFRPIVVLNSATTPRSDVDGREARVGDAARKRRQGGTRRHNLAFSVDRRGTEDERAGARILGSLVGGPCGVGRRHAAAARDRASRHAVPRGRRPRRPCARRAARSVGRRLDRHDARGLERGGGAGDGPDLTRGGGSRGGGGGSRVGYGNRRGRDQGDLRRQGPQAKAPQAVKPNR